MSNSEGGISPDSGRPLLLEAASEFMEDRAIRLGAGLAYYGLVTLAPLLVLLLGVGGLLVGQEAANGQLAASLDRWFDPDVALAISEMIVTADVAGTFANLTLVSLLLLVLTASVLFVAWKDAPNVIWGLEYRPNVKSTLARRLFGIASVGVLAAAMAAFFVVETLLAMVSGLMSDVFIIDPALLIVTSVVPLVVGAMLLGASFRYGTDGQVTWRAVWRGTVVTMFLLLVLSWGYGIYAGRAGTSLGAVASSALLLIVLVYFMAQVLLYGGEIIKVESRRTHS